jgi:Fic family protein
MRMPHQNDERRHSKALDAELIHDAQLRAEAEARNGLRQFDLGMAMVDDSIAKGSFRLRPSMLLALQRTALEGISIFAGNYRPAGVEIGGSKHTPPGAHLVAELVEDMCDYVNANWADKTAIHLAAYVMWRLNWIHPFADGNGRTSRILSYVVLNAKLGYRLPGVRTIPDQIVEDRIPYFTALDAADEYWRTDIIDVASMETLIETLLAKQLTTIYEAAGGKIGDPTG